MGALKTWFVELDKDGTGPREDILAPYWVSGWPQDGVAEAVFGYPTRRFDEPFRELVSERALVKNLELSVKWTPVRWVININGKEPSSI